MARPLLLAILLTTAAKPLPTPVQAMDPVQLDKNPFGQPGWLKPRRPAPATGDRPAETDEAGIPQLKLTATLISVREPLVIVNGRLLGIGEEIEGMRLGLIDEGRAVFYFRGRAHEFTIDHDQRAATR